jgi:hypothetical protein
MGFNLGVRCAQRFVVPQHAASARVNPPFGPLEIPIRCANDPGHSSSVNSSGAAIFAGRGRAPVQLRNRPRAPSPGCWYCPSVTRR